MRTEHLIADLASRAAPVRPLSSPRMRGLAWSALAIASAAVGVTVYGVRPNLRAALGEAHFVWTAVFALATSTLAVAASLVLAVPGAERSPALRGSAATVVGLWAVTLAGSLVNAGHGFAGAAGWSTCFARVIMMGLVPGVVLLAMLRRAAPLRLAWTGALAATAAMGVGAMGINLICNQTDSGHVLLGHFGPVLALGCIGAVIARSWLKRR
jgi:hypothetical protein